MIDERKLKTFAETMINAYKNTSILKEIARVDYYREGTKGNFFQIGERTLLPRKFFYLDNNIDNSILASDFARSVVWGEENFVIQHLIEMAQSGKIRLDEVDEFSNHRIIEVIAKSRNLPTDIFIPIDLPYFQEVHNWVKIGNAKYKSDGLYIMIIDHSIKVHWSTRFTPFNNIVYINKDRLRIIQKDHKNISTPKGFENIEYPFGSEGLKIDFAKSTEPDKFDFYFRSVIAIDEESIDKDFIGVIKLPRLEKSESE